MEDDDLTQQKLNKLQSKVQRHRETLKSAEAIKTAFILPFISLLGYDALDPDHTIVGYPSDGKTKMDYALRDDYELRVAVHLNPNPEDMSHERSQNFIEIFDSSEARVAIVTNGAIFQIHGSGEDGKYIPAPLLVMDLSSARHADATGLEYLGPESFDLETFRSQAMTRRIRDQIVDAIEATLQSPDERLAESVLSNISNAGDIDAAAVTGLIAEVAPFFRYSPAGSPEQKSEEDSDGQNPARPIMTEEETLAFHIIKAIGAKHVKPERIFARMNTSYVAVLLDDNNRNQIARIHYKAQSVKKIGFFSGENAEDRQVISETAEIYNLADKISERVKELISPAE